MNAIANKYGFRIGVAAVTGGHRDGGGDLSEETFYAGRPAPCPRSGGYRSRIVPSSRTTSPEGLRGLAVAATPGGLSVVYGDRTGAVPRQETLS